MADDAGGAGAARPLDLLLEVPLESPRVPGDGFDSFEALFDYINQWAKPRGYAIIILRSSDHQEGRPRRYDLCCDIGGPHYDSSSTGLRKASSKRRDCPWLAKAVQRKLLGDRWYFEVRNDHHNHEPSLHPSAHPAHRKRTWTEEQKQEIRQVFKTTTSGSRDVASLMREKYPSQVRTSSSLLSVCL